MVSGHKDHKLGLDKICCGGGGGSTNQIKLQVRLQLKIEICVKHNPLLTSCVCKFATILSHES